MAINHLHLNADVAYFAECLASAESHLAEESSSDPSSWYSQLFEMTSRSISVCLETSTRDGEVKAAKFRLFAFLLAKHYRPEASLRHVPAPSLALILDLAIRHRFGELFEV